MTDSNNPRKKAEVMAKQHKAVSISEFFEKNRHLLGYDNKTKALMIIVKEAVDNSLDACEEARILPDIYVKVEELKKEKYKIVIKDNGPGILKRQIPKIFGTLLYGSKFHRLRQSRGQQGLGISVAVLYSQLTTGMPTEVISSIGDGKIHKYILKIDVKRNEPVIISEEMIEGNDWHGLQVTFICEGLYKEHKQSILEYLRETSISNPFANIIFDGPKGKVEFKRAVDRLPKESKEIKPHLRGVEVGILSRMLQETKARTIQSFFTKEFSRVGNTSAAEICKRAEIDPRTSPRKITDEQIRNMIEAIKEVKLSKPPTDCLSPLGANLIKEGLIKELNPEFVASVTRPPAVYRGWPFIIEAGIAYGGSIEEPQIMRFANRVPLLYQQGDCAFTKAVQKIDWRRYKIEADKLPKEPIVIFIHIASVWVPFTSESKEAVSAYPIILKEVKLAVQEVTRRLSIYLSGVRRSKWQAERRSIFERYAGETANALQILTGVPAENIIPKIKNIIEDRIGEVIENGEEDKNGSDVSKHEQSTSEKQA